MYTLPWSGVSKKLEGVKTAQEAIVAGNLDWKVDIRNLYLAGKLDTHGIPCLGKPVSDRYGVVRDTDNETLGIVRGRYNPIQNRECFSFFDGVVEQGLAEYTHVGQVDGGSRIFIIARLPGSITIENAREDEKKIIKVLFLQSSHDGGSSLSVGYRTYREVCSNGLMAEVKGQRNEIRIRHSSNYGDQMVEARRVLGLADAYYKELEVVFNSLANVQLKDLLCYDVDDNTIAMEEFTTDLLPATKDKNGRFQVSKQRKKVRAEIVELYKEGVGNHGETAWDAYNAVVEYVDHHRTSRSSKFRSPEESRYLTSMTGDGARLKQQALDLLTIES